MIIDVRELTDSLKRLTSQRLRGAAKYLALQTSQEASPAVFSLSNSDSKETVCAKALGVRCRILKSLLLQEMGGSVSGDHREASRDLL